MLDKVPRHLIISSACVSNLVSGYRKNSNNRTVGYVGENSLP